MAAYEHPKGSGVWWILFYRSGVRVREKVGTYRNACDLYITRKSEALAGEKLPQARKKRVLFGELIDDAIEFAEAHNRNSRDFISKGAIVRESFGKLEASAITPQDLSRWLSKRCKTGATANRYKAFFSVCFREGLANGKVKSNPARLVRAKKEEPGRIRFLSREEYARLAEVVRVKYQQHFPAFVLSVHTGLRLSEQYTLVWRPGRRDGFIDLERGVVDLMRTKNGVPRVIPLNSAALEAAQMQRAMVKEGNACFPREGVSFDTRHWFHPALAEAKIADYVWHSNRHTFCSWLAMAGASLKTIQELAGHKTISMSARYSHLSPDHKKSEIERITGSPSLVQMPQRKGA